MKKNKLLIFSVGINIILLLVIIYLFLNRGISTNKIIMKYSNGNIAQKIKFITVDAEKYRSVRIALVQGYYRNGNLRIEGCRINGDWDFCKVYSPKKNKELISYISLGKGKINIPNYDGKISPKNTFYPMENMNCYYRYGEPLTKEEYERREKIQDDRLSKAKFLPKNLNIEKLRQNSNKEQ